MSFLAARCRVIAVDTPGYGMSDYPTNREYTVADYARTFATFLRSLNIERASVFGHHTRRELRLRTCRGVSQYG